MRTYDVYIESRRTAACMQRTDAERIAHVRAPARDSRLFGTGSPKYTWDDDTSSGLGSRSLPHGGTGSHAKPKANPYYSEDERLSRVRTNKGRERKIGRQRFQELSFQNSWTTRTINKCKDHLYKILNSRVILTAAQLQNLYCSGSSSSNANFISSDSLTAGIVDSCLWIKVTACTLKFFSL